MKINEKTLSSFSTCSAPCDREGWLLKRGEVNKSFQRRWFVLRGNLLFYFEKQGDKEPIGVIILEGCTVELAEDEVDVYAFKLVFHGAGKAGRVYMLGTQSQEDMEAWMKLLACSSYDYMKLMVVELEQQLAELEENERLAKAGTSANLNPDSYKPRAPPRNRHNPFNEAEQKSRKANYKRRWEELHQKYGHRVLSDRSQWQGRRDKVEVEMRDETLLVTI